MPAGSDVPDWDKKWNKSKAIDKPAGGGSSSGGSSGGSGGSGGGSGGTVKTYTVTDMPEWWGNESAKQYVWLFKTGALAGVGSWIPAELQGNTIKFSTSETFDKVITVRMNPTHPTIPDWPAKWNQSADLPVTNNTAVYAPGT